MEKPSLTELQHVVFEALGQASVAWNDGVFDSEQVQEVGDALVINIVRITGYGRDDTPESRDPEVIQRWLAR